MNDPIALQMLREAVVRRHAERQRATAANRRAAAPVVAPVTPDHPAIIAAAKASYEARAFQLNIPRWGVRTAAWNELDPTTQDREIAGVWAAMNALIIASKPQLNVSNHSRMCNHDDASGEVK